VTTIDENPTGDVFDDLAREAEKAADESGLPDDAGTEISLAEGENFVGRFRRDAADTDYGRAIFLLADRQGENCFIRGRTMLENQMSAAAPSQGDAIAIFRSQDGTNNQGQSFHRYIVRSRPFEAPGLRAARDKPAPEPPATQLGPDDEFPY
jgi:hypothetical protein